MRLTVLYLYNLDAPSTMQALILPGLLFTHPPIPLSFSALTALCPSTWALRLV